MIYMESITRLDWIRIFWIGFATSTFHSHKKKRKFQPDENLLTEQTSVDRYCANKTKPQSSHKNETSVIRVFVSIKLNSFL